MIAYADSLQGVLFPRTASSLSDATELWGVVQPGTTPDAFQRPNPNPTLRSVASGKLDDLTLSIAVQVGRIDVTLNYAPSSAADLTGGPPRIENVAKAIDLLSALMRRIARAVPSIRLAMILDLGRTIATGDEGKAFREELPNLNLPENSSDYLFQLNVPRKVSEVSGLALNRLCTWSVGQVGFMVAGPVPTNNSMMMTPYIGLKIDVNSPGNFSVDPEMSDVVLEQIANEIRLIYEYGYNRLVST